MTNRLFFLLSFVFASTLCDAQLSVMGNSDAVAQWHELSPTVVPTRCEGGGLKYADSETVSHDPSEAGSREILADGTMLWTMGYSSEGAVSMSVILRDVDLPEGGVICVMDETGLECHAVVSAEEGPKRYVGSQRVTGNRIIVQYAGPAADTLRFVVHNVCKGFIDIDMKGGGLKSISWKLEYDPACAVNAACRPDLAAQRRGVCWIGVNNNRTGSGFMINNTLCNYEPLLMTAAHVVDTAILSLIIYFDLEAPFCLAKSEPFSSNLYCHTSGASIVYRDPKTDIAVLRLSERPPAYIRPYWFGWSREIFSSGKVVSLHYPYATPMKVSEASYAVPFSSFLECYKNSFWAIEGWDVGLTYQGSSGSPLINSDMKAIGVYNGSTIKGKQLCEKDDIHYYSMLGRMWDKRSEDYPTLGEVLDPAGTGQQSLGALEVSEEPFVRMKEEMTSAEDAQDLLLFYLDVNTPRMRQRMAASERERTVYGVRVYESYPYFVGDGSTVDVMIQTADGVTHSDENYAFPVNRDMFVYDVFFSTPVAVPANEEFNVIYKCKEFADSADFMSFFCAYVGDGMDMEYYDGSKWKTAGKDGYKIFQKVYYSDDDAVSARQNPQYPAALSFRMDDAVLTVAGEPISVSAVYDRGGHLIGIYCAEGRPEQQIDLCGLPSGLYVVRCVAQSGNEKSLKVIVR